MDLMLIEFPNKIISNSSIIEMEKYTKIAMNKIPKKHASMEKVTKYGGLLKTDFDFE